MKDSHSKIRIKDIAVMAGVSEGTVDRVLHKRGEVSAKSREAVNKILEEINYQPNILARSLASKKQYRFICLYPEHQDGDYWDSVDQGFDHATKDFSQYNIKIEKHYYDQFDVESFTNVSNLILIEQPDAVLLAPVFRAETLQFTSALTKRQIPFSFIDSMLEEADFLTYYGQNSFQSGYIAAKLLVGVGLESQKILIIRTKRNGAASNQTLKRYEGFMQYIKENCSSQAIQLVNVELNDNNEQTNLLTLKNVFDNEGNIKAAITFNSKVYRLAKHLESLQISNVRLIGYDLLEQNINYLKSGSVSYLIAQRPEKQAYCTIRDICRELIFRQSINKINYVPIDILIKENIEYYTQFRE